MHTDNKMDYKKAYEDLVEEFDKWKRESIKWSIEDFTMLEKDGWQITEEQAQDALEDMIRHADCNYGVTWESVHCYYERYGEEVEEGTEKWREYIKEYEQ